MTLSYKTTGLKHRNDARADTEWVGHISGIKIGSMREG